MSRFTRRLGATLAAALVSAGLTIATGDAAEAAKRSVKDLLNSLPVAAEPASQAWDSFGEFRKSTKAGCGTVRTEALANDAEGEFPARCRITSSTWRDPYTGKAVTEYRDITLDQLVSKQEAWASGARAWDLRTRNAFLNDLGYDATLVAVSKKSAAKRNEREPSTWLPSTTAVRCAYVANWVGVKYRWGLAVDRAEKAALAKALRACGPLKIAAPKRATVTLTPVPTPSPTPTPVPTPTLDPRKDTCAELTSAGLGPYVKGQDPEYAWYRDDDADGTACETREGVVLFPSNDWQTERYTRSATPKISAAAQKQDDPAGSVNKRGVLHARITAAGSEVWRAAQDSGVTSDGNSQELYVDPALPDGAYELTVWSSYFFDVAEPPPAGATTLTFVVDTQAPGAPTYEGSARGGTAVSDAPDVAKIRFTYAEYPHDRPARAGQPVSWSAPMYSGPAFELRVQAIDRAGNTGAVVARSE